MAIARMSKISIALHSSHKDDILKSLQDESALHITKIEEKEESTENGALDVERIRHLEATLNQIDDSIKFLQTFVKKGGFLAGLVPQKVEVSEEKYTEAIEDFECDTITEEIKTINHSISKLRSERDHLQSKMEILKPWMNLSTHVELLKSTETTNIIAGTVNKRLYKEETLKKADEAGVEIEEIDESKNEMYLLILYHKSDEEKAREFLDDVNFAVEDFRGFTGIPSEICNQLQKRLDEIEEDIDSLQEQGKGYLDKYDKLLITYDHTLDEITRLNAMQEALTTKTTYIIQGWIETDTKEHLQKLIDSYEAAVIQEIEPLDDEKPPVKLVNRKIFRPFEVVTKLYGTPSYTDLDPSPLLAIFFAIFFGICITDAGYGIVLALLALYLMKKIPTGKNFLWLIFIGAVFTIIEGALLGGWFGNLFQGTFLDSITKSLMVFDPMKSYFVFYRLALALGVIQIYWGLILKVYEEIKSKNYLEAFLEGVVWILIITTLFIILPFASNFCVQLNLSPRQLLPGSMVLPAGIILILCAFIVVIFGARNEKNVFFRFFLGGLRFTILGGIFSYLGDFLSYIRLMALGLVTAGIANAINDIGRMMLGIPIAGVVIFVVILVGGHLFNLGINTLGGFVHTLRLQYVEFFQKFFAGGGKSFSPLRKNEKYIILKQT
jgi:V/A-type H+-transporting ATPase subunit I